VKGKTNQQKIKQKGPNHEKRKQIILMVAFIGSFLMLSANAAKAIIINYHPVGISLGQTLRLTSLTSATPIK